MNTVITPVVDTDTNEVVDMIFNDELGDSVVRSLINNNSFVPNIKKVIFSTSFKDNQPTLATVVFFADGTKSVVKNCINDEITYEEREVLLSDGTTEKVKTATKTSKEIGLAYAILKRIVCSFDENGTVQNAGFASFLRKVVNNATCEEIDDARAKGERRIRKAKAKEAKSAEKPAKPPKKSLRETVKSLADVVENLGTILQKLKPGKDENAEPQG